MNLGPRGRVRPAVRALHDRQHPRHVRRRHRVHPARGHAAHDDRHGRRARARGGAAARRALVRADGRVCRAARGAAGRGQVGARRHLRTRIALPVRRRAQASGRRARARAQRGRRRELRVVPGQRPHGRRVGHVRRGSATRGASCTERARARQRGRVDGPRTGGSVSPHVHRRRGDRPRGDGGGAAVSRSRGHSTAARGHRGRTRIPARDEEAVRRDRDRRLPAAVHPVPGGDARVLLGGALAFDARRQRARSCRCSGAR